ncbi:hypothetical protein N7530_008868 [Penicillium desertorum]|uniref:Uncharacterized protein n=1 Tax=Penicillium desertorum TaxID=1303715 RepID=A0A9W9WPV9_9EURO|nr:hypothetical protein N7530_008868 [Penicillium desertorum]
MDSSSEFKHRQQELLMNARRLATEAPLRRIYALFDLPYRTTDPEATKHKILNLWSLNKSRPEIRDFEEKWQESTDRASVEYRYEYWNRELEYLRIIARKEGLEAELKETPLRHEGDPDLRRMGF